MPYEHQGKKNSLIWDGPESGVADKVYEAICPSCRNLVEYCIKDCVGQEGVSDGLLSYILGERIVSKGDFGLEVKKGVSAYFLSKACGCCSSELWLILGVKEIQPQRYHVYYKSVVYWT